MSDIDTAMVLAAGFGTRMRPLTETTPKPLIRLLGKPLIDWSMERLRAGGVVNFVVNTHYLAEQLDAHFDGVVDVTTIRSQTSSVVACRIFRAKERRKVLVDSAFLLFCVRLPPSGP